MFDSALAETDAVENGAAAYSELKLRTLGKLSDFKSNVVVSLAEARKTSVMIESAAERLVSSYRAFRRGNFKAVAEILNLKRGTVHKNWLEYRYGWLPFMSDVKGQAEFFSQQWALGGRPPRFVVSASTDHKSKEDPKEGVVSNEWFYDFSRHFVPYGGAGDAYLDEFISHRQKQRLKVWVEIVNPSLAALQQVGITNPLLVAWEVVPYSFVIDWFISVGSWLEALTAIQGLRVVKAFYSAENVYEYVYHVPRTYVANANGLESWTYYEEFFKHDFRGYVRQPTVDLTPSIEDLRVKNPFPDWKKLITSLALSKGKIRG
jgi:hypothetical protein